MNTEKEILYKDLTGEIIEGAFNVHNTLGCGLLEKIYENSLDWELELKGREISSQKEFRIVYKEVGIYYANLVVDDKVIVEVKSVEKIDDIHRAQLLNYLRISGLTVHQASLSDPQGVSVTWGFAANIELELVKR